MSPKRQKQLSISHFFKSPNKETTAQNGIVDLTESDEIEPNPVKALNDKIQEKTKDDSKQDQLHDKENEHVKSVSENGNDVPKVKRTAPKQNGPKTKKSRTKEVSDQINIQDEQDVIGESSEPVSIEIDTTTASSITPPKSPVVKEEKPKPTRKRKVSKKAISEEVEEQDESYGEIVEEPKAKLPSRSTKGAPKSKRKTLTPLEKQIIELRDSNSDKMLVIQVGYKYKLFGEDARKAAAILNIMFIPQGIEENGDQFSYCSFPDFKLHINLKRLLAYGHKIGVVKQMESAVVKAVEKTTRSDLMIRELTGVYTKGTYMGDEFVSSGKNMQVEEETGGHIICLLDLEGLRKQDPLKKDTKTPSFALLAIQPSTGEIIQDTFDDTTNFNELETRLLYLNPSEVIVFHEKDSQPSTQVTKTIRSINAEALIIPKPIPEYQDVLLQLKDFFTNIDNGKHHQLYTYYTVNFDAPLQICINQMINYLQEFKLSSIFTIPSNITNFKNPKYMILSSNTINALEIFQNSTDHNTARGSLVWLLDHSRTKQGKRLLTKWISKPLINKSEIEERLQAIDDLTSDFNQVIDSFKGLLDKIGRSIDLEQLLIKVHYSSTYKIPKISRYEVYQMLESFNGIVQLTRNFSSQIAALPKVFKSSLLVGIFESMSKLATQDHTETFLKTINTASLLDETTDGHKINFFDLDVRNWPAISDELALISEVESLLDDELEKIKQLLQRPQLKFTTNNREPYLIEIRNGKQVDSLPANFQRINGTLTVSRFRTTEVSRLYKLLKYHQEMLLANCDQAFNEFLGEIDQNHEFFSEIIQILAQFDCLLSLTAASSIRPGYVKPKVLDEQIINIKRSRNPIIENLTQTYVPNNINLSYTKDRVLIITGPNMGGKSSYVKQVGLMIIMAQIGCYLPCDSAQLGTFDSIFIRMGSNDNILKGTSTFMNEMLECYDIINGMTNKSLIILDEVGRGTSTNDGISIAYSILRYLIESANKPIVLFITHYPSLHVLEQSYPGTVSNYHMGYKQIYNEVLKFPEIVFLYTLVQGVVNNSYGLNVARLADLPESIISKAFEVSEALKNKIEVEEKERFIRQTVGLLKSVIEGVGNDEEIVEKLEELVQL